MLKKIWKVILDSFFAEEREFYDNTIAPVGEYLSEDLSEDLKKSIDN